MKKKRCAFSVIVPIYNVQDYLRECVDSILEQTCEDIEIILVDDGSPDSCPQICDEYAAQDCRVVVIHKNNGGLSSARNAGIEVANGEYLLFVDSDDFWDDKDALSKIRRKIDTWSDADVIAYKSKDLSCITGKCVEAFSDYNLQRIEESNNNEVLKYMFETGVFPGAAWLVAVRRQYVCDNRFRFIEGIKAEDIDWLLNIFLHAKKIRAMNLPFYVYRKYRSGSITKTADAKSLEDIYYTIDKWCTKVSMGEYDDMVCALYGYLQWHFVCMLLIYGQLSPEQRKTQKVKIKEYAFLLKFSNSRKDKVIELVYKMLGPLACSKIMNVYRNFLTNV